MMSASGTPRSLLGLARQVWQLLEVEQQRECVSVLVISTVAAFLTLIGVAGIAPFFAVLADPTVIERSASLVRFKLALGLEASGAVLVWLGVGFVACVSLANLASLLAIRSIARFAQGVGARMHSLLFAEYLYRGIAFHARNHSAVLANHVVHDVNRTIGGVIQSGLTLWASAATIALITATVVLVDPPLALAAAASLSASYALIYSLVRRRLILNGAIATEHWRHRARVIAESFSAIKYVILHQAQPSMTSQLERHSAAIAAAQASTPAIAASPRYLLECLMAAGLVAAALWIHGAAGPDRWLTQLAFLGFAAYRLLPAVQQVFMALARIHVERPAFDGIVGDLLAARHRRANESLATPTGAWRGRPRREIRLLDVSYRYSEQRDGAVSGVSLAIPAGALVSLVGPNGAGKSTLAELILGLLVPGAGRIEIDGVELNGGNRHEWLDTVAYVPQQIALVDGTIEQNVAFGAAPDDVDHARVLEAVHAAQLASVVAALPDGVATVIGENGLRLSGGQRQRLGIARALYRRASLLVIDEGTSSLDALTEDEIVTLLGTLRRTYTIIVIGHRPSALAGCDLKFELDAGRLVGTLTVAEPVPDARARGIARL